MSIFNDVKDETSLTVSPFNNSVFAFSERKNTIIGRKIGNGYIPMTFGLNPLELKGIRENSDIKQDGASLLIGKKVIPLTKTNKILNLTLRGKLYLATLDLSDISFELSDDFSLTKNVWVYAEQNKLTFFSTNTEKFTLSEHDCMTSVEASCHIKPHKYLNYMSGNVFICIGERFTIYNETHYYSTIANDLPISLATVKKQIEKFNYHSLKAEANNEASC